MKMHEIPVLMTDKDFDLEYNTLKIKMEDEKQKGHDLCMRISYLIGWTTSDAAPIHTPEQLGKIYALAD